jgi:hypothetical protein
VRRAKIDFLMAKLNRFVIIDGKVPQEMFDRLMTLVGKIKVMVVMSLMITRW